MSTRVIRPLTRRFDDPRAWARAFLFYGPLAGLILGLKLGGGWAVVIGPLLGLALGPLVGLLLYGVPAWLIGRLIGLDRPVRHPELWAMHLGCPSCGWQTTPNGPWTRRDCMAWPQTCPECGMAVAMIAPDCPRCGEPTLRGDSVARRILSLVRLPRSARAAAWGDFHCRSCGQPFDRWGRAIDNGADDGVHAAGHVNQESSRRSGELGP